MLIGCYSSFLNDTTVGCAKKTGADFMESKLVDLEKMSYDEVRARASYIKDKGTSIPIMNNLFPASLRVTGDSVDYPRIAEYLDNVLSKARVFGTDTVVYGSGGARNLDGGFSRERADEQTIRICRDYISPAAEKYGMVCAVEELNRNACNYLNTCKEVMAIVDAVGRDNITLLADTYHMSVENEPLDSLADYVSRLSHVHIASFCNNRAVPAPDDGDDYKLIFDTLKSIGYKGNRVTLESSVTPAFEHDVTVAVRYLKSLM